MVTLQSFTTSISIKGDPAHKHEYHNDENAADGDDEHKATRYIEATDNAEFVVLVSCPDETRPRFWNRLFKVQVEVDGHRVCEWIEPARNFQDARNSRSRDWKMKFDGFCVGGANNEALFIPFQFAELNVQTSGNALIDAHGAQSTGTITIKISSFVVNGTSTVDALYQPVRALVAPVPKRVIANNNLTHRALGTARPANWSPGFPVYDGETAKEYTALFIYKYRSKHILQKMGFISETSPLAASHSSYTLPPEPSHEELRASWKKNEMDKAVKQEAIDKASEIKQERDEEVDEMMRSAVGKRVKRVKLSAGNKKDPIILDDREEG